MVRRRRLPLCHSLLNHGRAWAATGVEKEVAGGEKDAQSQRHDGQRRHCGEDLLFRNAPAGAAPRTRRRPGRRITPFCVGASVAHDMPKRRPGNALRDSLKNTLVVLTNPNLHSGCNDRADFLYFCI